MYAVIVHDIHVHVHVRLHVLQRSLRVHCTCVLLSHTQRPTGVGAMYIVYERHTPVYNTCIISINLPISNTYMYMYMYYVIHRLMYTCIHVHVCTCTCNTHTGAYTDKHTVKHKHMYSVFGETSQLHQQYQQSTDAPELYQTGQYTDQLYPLHAYNDIYFVPLHVLRRGCRAPHRLAYTEDH